LSMHVCGQTLVLVDNDATVSDVNQKLVKATLKYMFYHRPEDRAFSLSTYEHDVVSAEDFVCDTDDLVCSADSIEFEAKDSNLSDTLSEVITRWKESDFACRDILVFTDGLEGSALFHEKEELYYLLENTEYPVYIVMLVQDNNAEAKKGLSAISVTSGGKLFETEFPDSEAAVDRLLCEKIYAAMDEYAVAHWNMYEESAETEDDGSIEESDISEEDDGFEETQVQSEDYFEQSPATEGIIYERSNVEGFFEGTGAIVLSVALIVGGLLAGLVGSFIIMKKKRKSDRAIRPNVAEEEEYFEDYEIKEMETVLLDDVLMGDSPTRLLSHSGKLLTLSQTGPGGRSFRIELSAPMTVGRGDCDVVLTGDDALSKRHCRLYERDGNVYVEDLSSANGTIVNNVRIKNERLSDGDELTIGARTYIVGLT